MNLEWGCNYHTCVLQMDHNYAKKTEIDIDPDFMSLSERGRRRERLWRTSRWGLSIWGLRMLFSSKFWEILARLERYVGRKRSSHYMELARSDRYRDLARDLIVNYYDLRHQLQLTASGWDLQPGGRNSARQTEIASVYRSTPINDLVTFGENSLEKTEDKLVVKLWCFPDI